MEDKLNWDGTDPGFVKVCSVNPVYSTLMYVVPYVQRNVCL